MTQTIKTTGSADQPSERFRNREREIELEAALRRMWNFVRSDVPLDSLADDAQDECWALDKLGRDLLKKPK